VVGYGPFSLRVIHKEGLCSISGNINRLMMMMNSGVSVGIPWNIHININVCGQWTEIALPTPITDGLLIIETVCLFLHRSRLIHKTKIWVLVEPKYIHTYTYSRLIPEGVAEVSQIFLRDTHVLPKFELAMRITADVTGDKPIAVLLQSISGLSAINPLVAFYDIHGGKREVLFFYFVPDTTRDLFCPGHHTRPK
jgi:hypothetical protein